MTAPPELSREQIAEALPYLTPAERQELEEILEDEASEYLDIGVRAATPHVAYQARPIEWLEEQLGVPRIRIIWSLNDGYDGHLWDGTPDPFKTALDALVEWKSVGIESGTTTGKTVFAAYVVLWFLACWRNALVVTVAPKEDQLTLHVWKELGQLWPRFQALFPTAEKTSLRIRMEPRNDAWSAVGFVAGVSSQEVNASATKAQGFHAEHMLIILEELPGVKPAIATAFRNTCMAPHNLRLGLGNPDHQHDPLHQFCLESGVVHVRISALDHPNVVGDDPGLIPGAASRQRIIERAADYGEESDMYCSRVRGISPAQSSRALIKRAWVDAAFARWRDPEARQKFELLGAPALGIDVAQSENGDDAAVAFGRGAVLLDLDAAKCPNATELGRDCAARALVEGVAEENIGFDPVGVGAATGNELVDLIGPGVQALWGSGKPLEGSQLVEAGLDVEWAPDVNRFFNLRAQMYWTIAEDLRRGRIALRPHKQLMEELTVIEADYREGKIFIKPKEELRAKLGRSTNAGDAAVYWNFVRRRAASLESRRRRQDGQDPRAVRENTAAEGERLRRERAELHGDPDPTVTGPGGESSGEDYWLPDVAEVPPTGSRDDFPELPSGF